MIRKTRAALLGYDTRSLRSALIMRAVDLLNPFKRECPLAWRGPCVVSSLAGLGDLFIHLPLISGIVNSARARGIAITVALRPAHLEIGRRCGWDVLPFDNGLEDFFKNPRAMRLADFRTTVRAVRRRCTAFWIDLTGNAVSALAIKICGAEQLASRITRGGRSLIDHPLPHVVQENEYENRKRVADYLGCDLDSKLAGRFIVDLTPHRAYVVLCLTTASRWRNWPLENFRYLVERFPQTSFTIVGFRREVLPEEMGELDRIVSRPNVTNSMDQFSVIDPVELIAASRAVVTNDTSAAHIANFFGKPGAVLFGPARPETFATPDGLRVFHDATCPFLPCVQWRCHNQANWCMRKINPADVAAHLEAVLAGHARSTSAFSVSEAAHCPSYQPDWQRQTKLPV